MSVEEDIAMDTTVQDVNIKAENPGSSREEDTNESNDDHEMKECSTFCSSDNAQNSKSMKDEPKSSPSADYPDKKDSDGGGEKTKGKVYDCPLCDRTFRAEYRVELHIACEHSKKKSKKSGEKKTKCSTAWPCHLCERKFMDKMNLNRHLATTHSDKTPYSCQMCDRKFKLGQYLLKHFTSAHCDLERCYCEKCDHKFKGETLIFDHVRKVHCRRDPDTSEDEADGTDKVISKPVTSNVPSVSSSVSKVKKEVTSAPKKRGRKKKVQLSSGPVVKESRKDVLSSFTTQTYWNCAVCDRNLASRKKVEEHLLAAHFEDCPETPDLENYYNVHTNYICTICDLRFGQKMNLSRHLLTTHCKETPFRCEVCKRKFKLRQYIKKHFLSLHCNIVDFLCEKCDIKFEDITLLTEHVSKNHCPKKIIKRKKQDNQKPKLAKKGTDSEGEKKVKHKKRKTSGAGQFIGWRCEECDKEFSSKMSMERHIITVHSVETPFKCSECPRAFKLVEYLRKHYISKHCTFSTHYCNKCDTTFDYKSSLLRHVYDEHCPNQKRLGLKRRRASDSDNDEIEFPEQHPSVCPSCKESFPRHKLLVKHAKKCEKYLSLFKKENEEAVSMLKREYECILCRKISDHAAIFNTHLAEDHNVQFFFHLCSRNRCREVFV